MAPSRTSNLYDVLGLKRHALKADIIKAYRKLALLRHPDKDPGNVDAVAAFQRLNHAYQTLYDDNRRLLYDAGLREETLEQTEDQAHSDQTPHHRESEGRSHGREAKEAAENAARTKHGEDEWEAKTKTSIKSFLCLRDRIATMSASIQEMDQDHEDILAREAREKERRKFKTKIWDQDLGRIEQENAKRAQERLQQRNSLSIRLAWSKEDLKRIESQYRRGIQLQSGHRKSLAQRLEAELTEEMKIAQQEKRDRNEKRKAEEAAEKNKEEAARQERAKAMQEESDRLRRERADHLQEKQRAEARERGRKERDQRQQLLSSIVEQERDPTFSYQSQTQGSWRSKDPTAASGSPHIPIPQKKESTGRHQHRAKNARSRKGETLFKTGNSASTSNPDRTTWTPGSQPRASGNEEESCRHDAFWSKIRRPQQCSNCLRFCNAFIFECPKCSIRACDMCRAFLRQPNS